MSKKRRNHSPVFKAKVALATWLDRKGYDLDLIQRILGHESPDMSLECIDPDISRIESAFNNVWKI